jgi:hypothetical protein
MLDVVDKGGSGIDAQCFAQEINRPRLVDCQFPAGFFAGCYVFFMDSSAGSPVPLRLSGCMEGVPALRARGEREITA